MERTKNNKILINSLKVLWILFALLSFVFWMPQVDKLLCKDLSITSRHILLTDQWEVTINGDVYQDISLDDFYFESVNKGGCIVMERVLPDGLEIEQGVLRLHVKHAAVKIYINDELKYEYGYDRIAENKTVGSGLQFVNFPKGYEGKNIRFEWYVAEDEAFSSLDVPSIYEWKNVYKALITENRLPMFFGCFLVIFGLCLMIITMFALLFSRKYIRMYCIAVFSICMGLWTLCYYNILSVFSLPLYSVSLLEYVSLYLAPIPLIIYLGENVKQLKYLFMKVIYWILLAVQLVFDVVIVLLHVKDMVHFTTGLKYMQIIIVCHLIYFTVVLIMHLKTSKRNTRLYLLGVLIVGVCVSYDLYGYYQTRFGNTSYLPLKGASCVGVMILVFILILVFYVELTEKLMKETERNFLIKSAYTDELTQIHNRRYCSEQVNKISGGENPDFTVISFDLNNLKVVNDTYGHARGDMLIKSAADVIAGTFEDSGVVGRMGGDEFVAILKTTCKEDIDKLMADFAENIAEKNKENQDLHLSISYGFASSSEVSEKDFEKIYQMADDRMYQYKKQYKQNLKDFS